jgi:FixJ family two-component response regulator
MPPSPLTVIVVDDDVDIRRAVGRSLRSYGHRVHLFESGEECLAQNWDGDCAIVDIGLPGVSGLEMAERLRERGRGMPSCSSRHATMRPTARA